MKRAIYTKFGFLVAVLLFGLYMVLPSFLRYGDLPESQRPWYAKVLYDQQIKLGLDLRGGIHMVLGVDVDKAVDHEAERYAVEMRDFLNDEKIPFQNVQKDPQKAGLIVQLKDRADSDRLLRLVETKFNVISLTSQDDSVLRYNFNIIEQRQSEIERDTIGQALETIRNRIDQFGVSEPEIAAQGRTRIIVQLPGLEDPDRARQILGKTAQLEFKLVHEGVAASELFRLVESAKKEIKDTPGVSPDYEPKVNEINQKLFGKIPEGTEVLFGEDKDPTSGNLLSTPYLIESKVLLTGELLDNARVSAGGQFNQPVVNLTFNPRGAEIFERVTRENVQRRLAIVLDDKVNSAPTIQGAIAGGHAQITLGSLTDYQTLMKEARDLMIVLKAGALPAPVDILENRSVGPSLGLDSIRMGTKASVIGAFLVFLFMLFFYRIPGVFASVALAYNGLLILAILAMFEGTLTLPGIAGLVLTLGMAVDANIIIYERIREELGAGKPLAAAVQEGYNRANITILDSNLTTMIAGLVLLQYGSGPIKGFSVTLIIGLITSYFTSIWVSKYCLEIFIHLGILQKNLFSPKRSN